MAEKSHSGKVSGQRAKRFSRPSPTKTLEMTGIIERNMGPHFVEENLIPSSTVLKKGREEERKSWSQKNTYLLTANYIREGIMWGGGDKGG